MTPGRLTHLPRPFFDLVFAALLAAFAASCSEDGILDGDATKGAPDGGQNVDADVSDGSASLDASDDDARLPDANDDVDAGLFPECVNRELNIVAHTDDDLLFMSPDILRGIRAGNCMTTLYLTAGDADHDLAYVLSRELGVRAAYAYMAGEKDSWRAVDHIARTRTLRGYALNGAANIRLIFLGVPDGLRNFRYGTPSLKTLYEGTSETITTIDEANTFTREEFVDTILEQIRRFRPTIIRTGDPLNHGDDHQDHLHGALFAAEAIAGYTVPHTYIKYRGYNIGSEVENVLGTEFDDKWHAFLLYADHDPYVCGDAGGTACLGMYETWARRQYSFIDE